MIFLKLLLLILSLFVLFNYKLLSADSIDSIIWNRRYIIQPLVKEEYELIDYIFKNISFKFFIRKNEYISNIIRENHYWPDCGKIYNIWDNYNLWKYNYFIDVGANIGSCSILMLYKNLKVISFEPIKNNQHILTKTIMKNKKYINNFTLYTIGLSNESKKITMYENYKKTGYTEEVRNYKLDDVKINLNERIGMMKIDIECNELSMIEGAINFIK